MSQRPYITAIFAMSADGKIADYNHSAARFASQQDQAHLQAQVALVDGVLFGAGTLRAYGTTISVTNPQLLQARKERSQAPQPKQIVVSASGQLDPQQRFFQQPVPRWLMTTPQGAQQWSNSAEFEQIIVATMTSSGRISWLETLAQLKRRGLAKLALLGGGELLASLLAEHAVDELWLTVCPLILGGRTSPTPVGGAGFLEAEAKRLELLEVQQQGQELFLHYRIHHE